MNLKLFLYTLFIFCFASSASAAKNISRAGVRTGQSILPSLNNTFSVDQIDNSEDAITIVAVIPVKEQRNEKARTKFRIPSVTTELATVETGISRDFHLITSIGLAREVTHHITLPYYYLFLFRLTPF